MLSVTNKHFSFTTLFRLPFCADGMRNYSLLHTACTKQRKNQVAAEIGNPLDPSGSNPLGPTNKINHLGYILSVFYSASDY